MSARRPAVGPPAAVPHHAQPQPPGQLSRAVRIMRGRLEDIVQRTPAAVLCSAVHGAMARRECSRHGGELWAGDLGA